MNNRKDSEEEHDNRTATDNHNIVAGADIHYTTTTDTKTTTTHTKIESTTKKLLSRWLSNLQAQPQSEESGQELLNRRRESQVQDIAKVSRSDICKVV